MSKLVKILAAFALIVGVYAAASSPAEARGGWRGGGHWHGGGHWRGGGWGWGPGFGLGLGLGYGWGYPYYYGGPYYYPGPYYRRYYYGPDCGYVRVRVWRYDHWVIRRAWRCW